MARSPWPAVRGVTVGPDGTLIGERLVVGGELPFADDLDLYWIELAWCARTGSTRPRLCMLQDGAGAPGRVPDGLDYPAAIRSSSPAARRAMLHVARRAFRDAAMARHLGVPVDDLRHVLRDVYGHAA